MHIYNELFLKYGLILITLLIMLAYDIILLIFSVLIIILYSQIMEIDK